MSTFVRFGLPVLTSILTFLPWPKQPKRTTNGRDPAESADAPTIPFPRNGPQFAEARIYKPMDFSADIARDVDALVRSRDEDRWLSARYAPRPARGRLLALYALASEIELAPARVSEAPLGEIRLQWWRDALAEIAAGAPARAHPVVGALAAAGLSADSRAAIEAAIDARARLLYPGAFSSAADFAAWCDAAEGGVAQSAWRLLAPDAEAATKSAREAGTAYAIARRARALAPQFAEDALKLAGDLMSKARTALGVIPVEAAPAIAHCRLTDAYLRRPDPGQLVRRLVVFRAILSGRI